MHRVLKPEASAAVHGAHSLEVDQNVAGQRRLRLPAITEKKEPIAMGHCHVCVVVGDPAVVTWILAFNSAHCELTLGGNLISLVEMVKMG